MTETRPAVVRHPSALAPLANPAFRGIWIANLLSNVGGWMQSTGAAWEMTSLTPEPIFVALLAAASTLPMFLFCFPAGILADRFDRRLYIIACQVWMMAVAATMAALACGPSASMSMQQPGEAAHADPAHPDQVNGVELFRRDLLLAHAKDSRRYSRSRSSPSRLP